MVIGDQKKYLSCLLTLKVSKQATNEQLLSPVYFKSVVDEETGLPTDKLSEAAITECRLAGSMATTVSEITHRKDECVSRMIKLGIDEANKHAAARTHKVHTTELLIHSCTISLYQTGNKVGYSRY